VISVGLWVNRNKAVAPRETSALASKSVPVMVMIVSTSLKICEGVTDWIVCAAYTGSTAKLVMAIESRRTRGMSRENFDGMFLHR
jgi:hypothetical protein